MTHEHGKLLLTFDVEEFDLPRDLGRHIEGRKSFQMGAEGAERVAAFCRDNSIRATCFVTASLAEFRPSVVHRLVDSGLEIACHGARHADRYEEMGDRRLIEDLRSARMFLEETSGLPVRGHRSPRFCPISAEVLAGAGFQYDSSVHPTYVPGRYNGLSAPTAPYCSGGVKIIPVSVMPFIRLPLSWIWFRLYPEALLLRMLKRVAASGNPICLYFHGWELLDDPVARDAAPLMIMSGCGETLETKLRKTIHYLAGLGVEFCRIDETLDYGTCSVSTTLSSHD